MKKNSRSKISTKRQLTEYKKEVPAGPIASIEEYVRFVNTVPMLSAEEEYALAQKLRKENDLESAQQLILSHLRFVVSVARSFLGYGLSLSDLIQEGNIGLMKAVKRFDPSLGVRLVSFAAHWIKAEMHEFIIKNWKIVKVATTKPQRKLFFNLRSSHKRLGWMSPEEISHIAQELKVKESDVVEMEKRMNLLDMQFDAPLEENEDNHNPTAPAHYLTASTIVNPEEELGQVEDEQKIMELHQMMEQLDDRSQAILMRRWLNEPKATLQELAAEYQISPERVRQIETAAMKKLQKTLKK